MPGNLPEALAEPVPPGGLELATEVVRAHAVCLVDDGEVPVGRGEPLLQVVVARQDVESGDHAVATAEGLPVHARPSGPTVRNLKVEPELLGELVLPLLDQRAGGDDEAPREVTAEQQLLDVEAGHDRLARAGLVGQQEAERALRQQLAVHGGDLVRQRLDRARRNGEHRVELRGHGQAPGPSHEHEQSAVAGELERPSSSRQPQPGLLAPEDEPLAHVAVGPAVGDVDDRVAVGLDSDHGHGLVAGDQPVHLRNGEPGPPGARVARQRRGLSRLDTRTERAATRRQGTAMPYGSGRLDASGAQVTGGTGR